MQIEQTENEQLSTGARPTQLMFHFTGNGGEYFKIWIVNLLLSVITLGIYSAWAKVRRMKYFYNGTSLEGSVFDYHADPVSILKGRLIAVPVLFVAGAAGSVNPLLAYIFYLIAVPWLVVQSLRFNAANTSFRGVRFAFTGSTAMAYRVMSLEILYVLVSFGLLYPLWRYRVQRYVYSHLRFGDMAFQFGAPLPSYCWPYLAVLLIAVPLAIIGLVFGGVLVALIGWAGGSLIGNLVSILIGASLPLVLFGIIYTRNRNLVFNHLGLGRVAAPRELEYESAAMLNMSNSMLHRFLSTMTLGAYLQMTLLNTVLTILTLGLYLPFAAVSAARFKVENTQLLFNPAQGDVSAAGGNQRGVIGSEATDTGGYDLGL